MSSRVCPRAFTLIDLLVVMAIAVLLIAFMLPSNSASRARARAIQCLSQQRQMGFANHLYADEWDGFFVPIYQWGEGPSAGPWVFRNAAYPELLGLPTEPQPWGNAPYKGNDLVCPSVPSSVYSLPGYDGGMGHNYGFNVQTLYPKLRPYLERDIRGAKRGSVIQPSSKAQMVDSSSFQVEEYGSDPAAFWDVSGDTQELAFNAVAYRHGEGANILHFDGHAAYYTKEKAHPGESGTKSDESDRLWDVYGQEKGSHAGSR